MSINNFFEFIGRKIKSIDYKSILVWSVFMFALFHLFVLIDLDPFIVGLVLSILLSILFPLYQWLKKGFFPKYLITLSLIFIITFLYHSFTFGFYVWVILMDTSDAFYYLLDFIIIVPFLSFLIYSILYLIIRKIQNRWAH